MRGLIRPTLIMVARIGLVLSVVAWVVAQWSWVQLHLSAERILLGQKSIHWVHWDDGAPLNNVKLTTGNHLSDPLLGMDDLEDSMPAQAPVWLWGGIMQLESPCGLMCRHWFLITLFTVFNIALLFIYRKRPEGKPCEDD